MMEKDEEKKKELEEMFIKEVLPNYMKNLEKILIARGGKFFAGNEVNNVLDTTSFSRIHVS